MANEIKKINVAGTDYDVVDVNGRKEAYLEWGGKNLRGTYGPVDAAMVPDLGANRFAFLNNIANSVAIEYSRDGGSTWTDYGATAGQKSNLFNGNGSSFIIGKPDSGTVASNQYQLRVSILTSNDMGRTYTTLNKFIAYVSTSGTSNNWVTIRGRKQSDYEAGTDTWTVFATKVPVDGWSGYNVINTTGITTYGNTKTAQYGQLQFIFGCDTGSTTAYQGLNIQKIFAYGGMGWTPPSNMAKNGHMYTFDSDQNVTFPAKVTATGFVKSGGTAAQFLKANGTIDSNTYIHTAGTGLTKSGNTLSANIEDSVTSTATNKMLSAKQGKVLNDKISAIEGRGRYLSIWDASTGKPNDLPGGGSSTTEIYTYKSGDYFIVKTAGNKVPSGTSIPAGTTIATFPSADGESSQINDSIYFNGTSWAVLHTPAGSGDVTGPAAAGADGNIAVFNGTTGKIIKDSSVNISNIVKTSGNQNIAGSKTFTNKITAESGVDFNVNGHEIIVDSNDDLVVAAGQDNLILGDPTYGDGHVYIVSATEGNQVVKKSEVPTESTVSGWGFTKNLGTITGITMNGASKGTSGVVDLGTVITAHQDISGKANLAGGNTFTGAQTIDLGSTYGAKLEVTGSGGDQCFLLTRSDGAQCVLEAGGSIGLFGTKTNHPIQVRTNYTNRMTIGTDGSVVLATDVGSSSNDNQVATTKWTNSKLSGKSNSDHTHTTTIAADSGTSQLSLAANTKYKLTAGGTTFIFTTPDSPIDGVFFEEIIDGYSLTITFAGGDMPVGCYVKVNGKATSSNYDYILENQFGAQVIVAGLQADDYVTCYTGNQDCSLSNPVNCTLTTVDTFWRKATINGAGDATVNYEYYD